MTSNERPVLELKVVRKANLQTFSKPSDGSITGVGCCKCKTEVVVSGLALQLAKKLELTLHLICDVCEPTPTPPPQQQGEADG